MVPTRAPVDPVAVLAALPTDVDAVLVRDGRRWVVAAAPERVVRASGDDALAHLDGTTRGWWAGWLAYDLGRAVEAVRARTADDLGIPDLALGRFDARIEISEGGVQLVGEGASRSLLETALARAAKTRPPDGPALGPWHSSLSRDQFEAAVRALMELIRAGDCYQVNLTRRLTCEGPADPVALLASLARHNPAPHAAFVRFGETAAVSASPELFLRRRGDEVVTRPIKGTARDPRTLMASMKDRAENVMIVDLARNDLGRVCEYGSVETPGLCEPERHPGLYHLVSTVRGRLRPGVTAGDLIRATFPPASVTGCPKPRVLQAIEDLEPVRRGIYCGALGWIDHDYPALELNVAIRTFTVTPQATSLGVGGGVVADSRPDAEWEETALKAARLLRAAGVGARARVPA